MKLLTKCQNCKSQIRIRDLSSDRVDFAKTAGEYVMLTCKNCKQKKNYHVDELEASPGIVIHIIASIILLFGTPLVIFYLWSYLDRLKSPSGMAITISIAVIPVIIYVLFLKSDQNRVRAFNRHKLKP